MIPDYQSVMLPLMRYVEDGKEYRIGDVVVPLSKKLGLTDEEMTVLLPSGRQTVFANRVHWAKTYLAQAKVLEITRRAHFRITDRGQEILRERPARIDVRLLERFPEFNEFRERRRPPHDIASAPAAAEPTTTPSATVEATPDELLRTTVADLEAALSSELLDRILAAPPAFFESLIVTLLLNMSYGGSREDAGRAIGRSGDGGIDGVIDQDPLGLDRVSPSQEIQSGRSRQRTRNTCIQWEPRRG